jgi:hypothetical protein
MKRNMLRVQESHPNVNHKDYSQFKITIPVNEARLLKLSQGDLLIATIQNDKLVYSKLAGGN